MRLFAAIVPPRDVLEELTKAIRSTVVAPDEPQPRRFGLLSPKRGAHAAGRPQNPTFAENELALPDLDRLYMPVSQFGNVTLGDSVRLADAVRAEAATWPRPRLAFAGGGALEFPGDESVWANLEGDVDDLLRIGRGVPEVVQRLGFFVDRRQFRPALPVGVITEQTTAPFLQRVVDTLEAFHGQSWTVDSVWLMQRPPESRSPDEFEVMEQLPLARS